jgi:hypothetical protein
VCRSPRRSYAGAPTGTGAGTRRVRRR